MDAVDFAQYLYKELRTREQDLAMALARGSAKTYEEYRTLVGEIQGLSYARSEMRALLEKTDNDIEELFSSKNDS
jgi:hypothetical protein